MFSDPVYLFSPLLAMVVSLVLLIIVWRGAPSSSSKHILLGLLASFGMWGLLTFGMRSSSTIEQATMWEKPLIIPAYVIYLLFYQFTVDYTGTRGQKKILIGAYLILLLVVLLSPTSLIIRTMRVEAYGFAAVLGPGAYLSSIVGLALFGGGLYNLMKRYRVSDSYEERTRLNYFIIAAFISLAGALTDAFSPLPPVSIWTNIVFCTLCSIAIVKYHLLDIRFVMKKSLVFFLVSLMIAVPYTGILYGLTRFFGRIAQQWWLHFLLIVVVATILLPLYWKIQKIADRLFYRERYDYLEALYRFSSESRKIGSPEEIGHSLLTLIRQALQCSSGFLFLADNSGYFRSVSSTDPTSSQLLISQNSGLLAWLDTKKRILNRQEITFTPQLQYLEVTHAKLLADTRAALFVPIFAEQQLIAFLVLGEKLSQQPYDQEDQRLLATIASRVGVELENVMLFDLEKRAIQDLEEQNRQKTEFLHGVAHELKTPLTAILSSSELLGDDSATTAKFKPRLINNIRQSATSMNQKVDALLDLARLQVGETRIDAKPVDLNQTILEAAAQLRILFENKNQRLVLEIPPMLPKVNGDKDKLAQVLFNLLSNANKFSPADSDITVSVRDIDQQLVVAVADSAPPISDTEKSKLFQPYYRGEDAERRIRIPGLGLGLVIAKRIVELHHGRIWVETTPGKGNIFAFSLPALGPDSLTKEDNALQQGGDSFEGINSRR
ncbi:MAG: ATP-binding protein [Chloroflexota bacterium]